VAEQTLLFHPADVLMFRDGRPFGVDAGHAESDFPPLPRTVVGAVWGWLRRATGVGFDQRPKSTTREQPRDRLRKAHPDKAWLADVTFRGPFICRESTTYYPAPKTLVRLADGDAKGELRLLQPVEPDQVPGYTAPCGAPAGFRPLGLEGGQEWEPLADGVWLNGPQLRSLLAGQPPEPGKLTWSRDLFLTETRTGIGMERDVRTVTEGLLYTASFTRLRPGVALRVDVCVPDDATPYLEELAGAHPWLQLGGEGRIARVEHRAYAAHPSAPEECAGRPLTYLATPARFLDGGWWPTKAGATPLAAAVGAPVVYSGWDLASQRPLPSRCAVAAGAVYFWKDGNTPRLPHGCLGDYNGDRRAGYGFCLEGKW
jgi:CRISPR-associated protein Cmr3